MKITGYQAATLNVPEDDPRTAARQRRFENVTRRRAAE